MRRLLEPDNTTKEARMFQRRDDKVGLIAATTLWASILISSSLINITTPSFTHHIPADSEIIITAGSSR